MECIFLNYFDENCSFQAIASSTAISTGRGISLFDQVNAFMWAKQGQTPPDALYVVMIGGNDIVSVLNCISNRKMTHNLKKIHACDFSFMCCWLKKERSSTQPALH